MVEVFIISRELEALAEGVHIVLVFFRELFTDTVRVDNFIFQSVASRLMCTVEVDCFSVTDSIKSIRLSARG